MDGRAKMDNEGSAGKLDKIRGILEEILCPPTPTQTKP